MLYVLRLGYVGDTAFYEASPLSSIGRMTTLNLDNARKFSTRPDAAGYAAALRLEIPEDAEEECIPLLTTGNAWEPGMRPEWELREERERAREAEANEA